MSGEQSSQSIMRVACLHRTYFSLYEEKEDIAEACGRLQTGGHVMTGASRKIGMLRGLVAVGCLPAGPSERIQKPCIFRAAIKNATTNAAKTTSKTELPS